MRRNQISPKVFLILAAITTCVGFQSCSKTSGNKLVGAWNVVKATADTSIHTQSGLDAVVMASMMSQGAVMNFGTNDSLTMTMPPDNTTRVIYYSVLPNNSQISFRGKSGRLDTINFNIAGDTLTLKKNITIKLTRGAI